MSTNFEAPGTDLAAAGDTGLVADDGGAAVIAADALATATPADASTDTDPYSAIITALPADDTDIAAITDSAQLQQQLTEARGHLRQMGTAYTELAPLRPFRELGEPSAVQSRLKLAELLYSPVIDPATNQPKRDPHTQTLYRTTRPFVSHLDTVSPGMVHQLLVDILDFQPLADDGRTREARMIEQLFAFYKLNFARLADYQGIDALAARATGSTITAEELAEIPSQYHAAYQTIPPSVRAAWKSYETADQTRMLEDYKGRLDSAERDKTIAARDAASKAAEAERYANAVFDGQVKYFDTVRRDRTSALIKSLTAKVTYSTDPVNNRVMIGSLAAGLAQLLDPQWRFVYIDEVLTPLGLKLDSTFDAALEKFETNAMETVAQRMAGDAGQSAQAHEDATSAVNQLMAKIAIFALKVAAAQGATVAEGAAAQAAALATAGTTRPTAGAGTVGAPDTGGLPPGMRPGSPEANAYWASRFPRSA